MGPRSSPQKLCLQSQKLHLLIFPSPVSLLGLRLSFPELSRSTELALRSARLEAALFLFLTPFQGWIDPEAGNDQQVWTFGKKERGRRAPYICIGKKEIAYWETG